MPIAAIHSVLKTLHLSVTSYAKDLNLIYGAVMLGEPDPDTLQYSKNVVS